ncbi:MAG: valine--tRNA ligase [Actinobacteria bacterium]|nr:MAG: valine--tRNA ligase [Actinomycetota bacterium]
MPELPKVYDPKKVENKWYKYWLDKKYFHAVIDEKSKPFTVVIPPPNVTGTLHVGHALNNTLQDIVVRKKRMEGFVTLWLPGTDHAGIATQNVVEKELAKVGVSRHDIGRKDFTDKVWQWREKYGNIIIDQLKSLGASCDWDRERFTMDEAYSKAVREVFVHLYRNDLIYRGYYIINWCSRCHTALSDIEVEHLELKGNLWYIKYPIKDESSHITVATTRPETMLGDTAVAVNPNDKRYKKLIGKSVILPLMDREIPIIADKAVDPSFGTGAVKVTPAHDPNDFDIGKRHGLEEINIFNDDAKVNENGGKYDGQDRYQAREAVVADLEKLSLLEKTTEHLHAVGHCYRCDTVIEPRLSLQWFVKMQPLAGPAMVAVEKRKIEFVPKKWTKIYFDWMENIKDWCISRQIWWGHQIPVWYCQNCEEMIVDTITPSKCPTCKSSELIQEEDVLDTWFSSALWPFATLGWPEKTVDLRYFYPTSLLSTSFDILYFWVARMIMMGIHFMDNIPFDKVYIHALIRDAHGKKMSKSRGNVIDPMTIIDKFGTDALRFTLASLAVPGRDVFLSQERIEGYRNFANKIWNVGRFILSNVADIKEKMSYKKADLELADIWILSRCNDLIKEVDKYSNNYDFSKAAKSIYNFIWSELADWYLELSKQRLYEKDKKAKKTVQAVLLEVFDRTLKMLHPYMPFITEEIWQMLPGTSESIVVADYPKCDDKKINKESEKEMQLIMDVVVAVRSIRSELKIAPARRIKVILSSGYSNYLNILRRHKDYLISLAKIDELLIEKNAKRPDYSAIAVEHGIDVFIPLEGLVDAVEELKRIKKELVSVELELEGIRKKLKNKEFVSKAPQHIVSKEKDKEGSLLAKLEKLEEQQRIFG